jgi:hypothetical protein
MHQPVGGVVIAEPPIPVIDKHVHVWSCQPAIVGAHKQRWLIGSDLFPARSLYPKVMVVSPVIERQ